jgi:hypothetical protein
VTWICDFCSEQPVTWSYPARSFVAYVVGAIESESVGDWACCDVCHALIESGDADALAERAIETLSVRHPETRPVREELLREMKVLHRFFFDNRLGAALPLQSDVCAGREQPELN